MAKALIFPLQITDTSLEQIDLTPPPQAFERAQIDLFGGMLPLGSVSGYWDSLPGAGNRGAFGGAPIVMEEGGKRFVRFQGTSLGAAGVSNPTTGTTRFMRFRAVRASGAGMTLMSRYAGYPAGPRLALLSSDGAVYSHGGNATLSSGVSTDDGAWHTVIATFGPGNAGVINVDGTEVTGSPGPGDDAAGFTIRWGGSAAESTGRLDVRRAGQLPYAADSTMRAQMLAALAS